MEEELHEEAEELVADEEVERQVLEPRPDRPRRGDADGEQGARRLGCVAFLFEKFIFR